MERLASNSESSTYSVLPTRTWGEEACEEGPHFQLLLHLNSEFQKDESESECLVYPTVATVLS